MSLLLLVVESIQYLTFAYVFFQTSCDVSACGMYIVTGSTGFNGNGCDVTVSLLLPS